MPPPAPFLSCLSTLRVLYLITLSPVSIRQPRCIICNLFMISVFRLFGIPPTGDYPGLDTLPKPLVKPFVKGRHDHFCCLLAIPRVGSHLFHFKLSYLGDLHRRKSHSSAQTLTQTHCSSRNTLANQKAPTGVGVVGRWPASPSKDVAFIAFGALYDRSECASSAGGRI